MRTMCLKGHKKTRIFKILVDKQKAHVNLSFAKFVLTNKLINLSEMEDLSPAIANYDRTALHDRFEYTFVEN